MEKAYNPHAIEQRWYQFWEDNGHFAPSGEGSPYCIMIPPPNVTGTLHMGHAFQDTIMDALTRFHRMKGNNTLWQAGSDHAGIATQMVVERQLAAEGKSRHDLGREQFVERVWEWKEHSGGHITRQLRRMGASLDWSRERFTMDEGLSSAVKEVFVRLYEEGLIYRGQRLVNWDPVLHTAVSDLEVVSEEEQGFLWHMRYPLSDGSGHLVVATTRPETMLGDTAVAVHPEDERYQSLIGKTITLPLVGREIPIIADDYVDPEFGTGCVKITPAHDFNDYAMGQRHDLPMINVLTVDARINGNAPEKYRGQGPLRGTGRDHPRPQGTGAAGEDRRPQADGPARRPLRHRHRALPHRPVVRGPDPRQAGRRAPGRQGRDHRPGHRRGALRQDQVRPRQLGQHLLPLAGEHPGLVHQPPDLVGPPHSRLVRRGRQRLRRALRGGGARQARPRRRSRSWSRTPTSSTPGSPPPCGPSPPWAGRSRPRS